MWRMGENRGRRVGGSAAPQRTKGEGRSEAGAGSRGAGVLYDKKRGRGGRQLIGLDLKGGRATKEPTEGQVISAAISPSLWEIASGVKMTSSSGLGRVSKFMCVGPTAVSCLCRGA